MTVIFFQIINLFRISSFYLKSTLLRVNNDFMMSTDRIKAVLLVILDMSAAFDIIDRDVLFSRLEKTV